MYTALIILGVVLLVIGLLVAVAGAMPYEPYSETTSIPAGEGWYTYYELYLPFGNELTVSFDTLSGGTVNVYVFTKSQYETYSQGGFSSCEYSDTADSGVFTFVSPDSETYYLVFEHGPGSSDEEQEVTVTHDIEGIDTGAIGIGVVLLGVGFAVLAGGMIGRKKTPKPTSHRPPPSDVVLFRTAPPPPPPPPPSPPGPPSYPPP